jgi:hypothetical protein
MVGYGDDKWQQQKNNHPFCFSVSELNEVREEWSGDWDWRAEE